MNALVARWRKSLFVILGLALSWNPAIRADDTIQPATAPYGPSRTGSGNSHAPVWSGDGSCIAFVSHANNLVTNDDQAPYLDLFVRDLGSGKTELVSISTNAFGGANSDVGVARLSSNGRFLVFETDASNLAPGDNNQLGDIYLRDRVSKTTRLVSVAVDGTSAANGRSFNPLISSDGRYVVFESLASNLVTNDFNGTNDVFIHDLTLGTTTLVSVNRDGSATAAGSSHSPSIAADGLRVAFVSQATNLVNGVTNRLGEVYVRDVTNGLTRWAVASHILSTWTRSPASSQPVSYRAFDPVLTADGHYVAFKTEAGTVRFDLERPVQSIDQAFTNGAVRSYLHFDDNPRVVRAASMLPLSFAGNGGLLFYEAPTNLPGAAPIGGIVRADFDNLQTNAVFGPCPGCQGASYLTNVGPSGEMILTNNQAYLTTRWSRLNWLEPSPGGEKLLFLANLTNFNFTTGRSDFPGTHQIYSWDSSTRQIQLVSTNRSGQPGPQLIEVVPSATTDGSRLAWDTLDADSTEQDLNRAWDVLIRNLTNGTTVAVSTAAPSLPGGTAVGLAVNPISLSADGSRIAFVSTDSSLVINDQNQLHDIFVRDLTPTTNPPLSSLALPAAGSPAGYSGLDMAASPILSADGRYLAYSRVYAFYPSTNRSLYWADLSVPTNRFYSTHGSVQTLVSEPVLTSDGRFMAYSSMDPALVADSNSRPDVFVVVTHAATNVLGFPTRTICASTVPDNQSTGNGESFEPRFSPDGSWIVFRSSAMNLLSEQAVNSLDYQLYARRLGCTDARCATNLASAGYFGPTRFLSYERVEGQPQEVPLIKGAHSAAFSGDSRWVAFASGTGAIYRHDLQSDPSLETGGPPPNLRVCVECAAPALNADGNLIAYESKAGGVTNIHCKNLLTDADELISVNRDGTGGGNGRSFSPLISQNGRFVVFVSQASDLVENDTNRASDVFIRDRWNQITHCLSRNWQGTATGNRVSSHPVLSADGRTVAFQSFAGDLVPGDYNDTRDVFVVTLAGPDTDGDGLDDELELAYFNTLSRDGTGDFDGDGISDALEIRSGTNPADQGSVLAVLTITTGLIRDGGISSQVTYISWRAAPGHRYRVQYRTAFAQGSPAAWTDLPGEVVTQGTMGSFVHMAPIGPAPARGFYRVKQLD